MSKPWGNIGAWAAEAEREEEEEARAAAASATTAAAADTQSFPSLREAVKEKPKKKKMSLSEFSSAVADKLTPDEMMRLPTAPRERTAEGMQYGGRLGGGFPNYGARSSGAPPRDDGGLWGGRRSYGAGGGFEEERRLVGGGARVSSVEQQQSRADEVDNWAMGKKAAVGGFEGRGGDRQSRYGSLGGGGSSRADEVDNWAVGKKPVGFGAPPSGGRSSTFGSGFRDSRPEPDRWTRGTVGVGGGSAREERPKLVLDPPKGDLGLNVNEQPIKSNKPNPFGQARPREEVLAEKGLDWKKLDSEIEAKKTSSRPTSAQSSRPSSAQSSRSEAQGMENVVKQRPKVNPFGDAKPREVLLEEKGVDWRKIDLELERKRIDRYI